MNRRVVFACGLAGLGVQPAPALERLAEHIDITPAYDVGAGTWSWALDAGGVPWDPAQVYLPGRDLDFDAGERFLRPGGAGWNFLGVGEGEPVWIYPAVEGGNPHVWLGFGNTQPGVFSGNLEVALAGVDGPPGGVFAMFDDENLVYFRTDDGISGADVWSKPPNHAHVNWSFSQRGMWRVRLTVVGWLGPGETNPTPVSAEVPLHFAIGRRAWWRAEWFDAATVMDEAVAGDQADPDGDGLVNMVEYALGGDPLGGVKPHPLSGEPVAVRGGRTESGGQEYLTLTFHRRTAAPYPEIEYSVEWADDPAGGSWSAGGDEIEVTALGDGWERVTVRDSVPATGAKRFGRVAVTAL